MRYEFKKSDQKASKVRLNAALYAMALDELVQGPTTRAELREVTGLSVATILSIVSALRKRKLIHVAEWERDISGRWTVAAFAFGGKPDAKKPAPRTDAENKRAQRAARRNNATLHATVGIGAGMVA